MGSSYVDVMGKPCTKCSGVTFNSNRVCLRCAGVTCPRCNGLGEHSDECPIGQAIASARWRVARSEARRSTAA